MWSTSARKICSCKHYSSNTAKSNVKFLHANNGYGFFAMRTSVRPTTASSQTTKGTTRTTSVSRDVIAKARRRQWSAKPSPTNVPSKLWRGKGPGPHTHNQNSWQEIRMQVSGDRAAKRSTAMQQRQAATPGSKARHQSRAAKPRSRLLYLTRPRAFPKFVQSCSLELASCTTVPLERFRDHRLKDLPCLRRLLLPDRNTFLPVLGARPPSWESGRGRLDLHHRKPNFL